MHGLQTAVSAYVFKFDRLNVRCHGFVSPVTQQPTRLLPCGRFLETLSLSLVVVLILVLDLFRLHDLFISLVPSHSFYSSQASCHLIDFSMPSLRCSCSCYCLQIPTALPIARRDYPDVVFRNRVGANAAMLNEVERLHKDGRPVLIGTTNVRMSDQTAKDLEERGVPCQVYGCFGRGCCCWLSFFFVP